MKKKILIVIVAVAMMIPLLAVGVCADYSPETGWSEPDQIIDGPVVLTFPRVEPDFSVTYRVIDFYGYELIPDFNSIDPSKFPTGGVLLPEDYEWYYTASSESMTGTVIAKGLWLTSDGLYTNASLTDGLWDDFEFKAELVQAVYFGSYPPPVTEEGLQFFSSFEFEVVQYIDPRSPFLILIELMFDNFSRIIGGLAAGVTGAFTALIWENLEATEKTLSTAAKFIFTIAGLSIGMTVFYMVLRLIRFGRQR